MTHTIKDTERLLRLSGYFGRRRAFLTGRDVTGLILLIEKLSAPDGRVILPAMCCMTRLAAVLETGRTPIIVDVDPNLNLSPKRLAEVAREGDLVVGVHLFGIPFDVDAIEEICELRKCILVEDASQAIGGKIDGKRIGSFGKASILSFADRKILPTIGGGAVMTDDSNLFDYLEEATENLPGRPADYNAKKTNLQKAALEAFNAARMGDPQAASKWHELYEGTGDIYKFSITSEEADAITDGIVAFENTVQKRREMVYLFMKNITHPELHVLEYPTNTAPFRFTIILPEEMDGVKTQQLTDELRNKGFDVANLYIPLHWLAPDKVITEGCPQAEEAGTRIINLRIDDSTTRSQTNTAGGIINNFMQS